MANHKRRRAKHQRSGCLMCKPHKDNRIGKRRMNATMQQRRADAAMRVAQYYVDSYRGLL